jgi:hypothetical protein
LKSDNIAVGLPRKYRVYFQTFGGKNPKSCATTTGSVPLKVEVL